MTVSITSCGMGGSGDHDGASGRSSRRTIDLAELSANASLYGRQRFYSSSVAAATHRGATLPPVLVLTFAVAATLFGFAPTGLLAVVYGVWAWSDARRGEPAAARARRQAALKWCWISVAIGALV